MEEGWLERDDLRAEDSAWIDTRCGLGWFFNLMAVAVYDGGGGL